MDDGAEDGVPAPSVGSLVILASVFLILECERNVAQLAECWVVVGDDLVGRVAKDYSLEGDDLSSPGCGAGCWCTRRSAWRSRIPRLRVR